MFSVFSIRSAVLLPGLLFAFHAFDLAAAETDPGALAENRVNITDLSKPDSAGKSYLAATIVNAPVSKLCAVILDFPAYPGFMPNTDQTRVVQATDAFSIIDMTLKLPLGKIKKYRLRMEPKIAEPKNATASCHLSWKMVQQPALKQEETIADTSGYWDLQPLATDKTKSVVKYFVYSDPGPVPMGLGWVVDSLGKDSLPKTLEALRAKVVH
ncbi:MAG TPA: hypothetical protein VIF60_13130 [Burkholderiaceae bacterium]|jgi:hypothetical protein